MNRQAFVRSLGFGLVAALTAFMWTALCARWLSAEASLGLFALFAAALYPLAVAPDLSRGVRGMLMSVAAAAVAAAALWGAGERLLLAMLLLALVRSGYLYRRRPSRALALEAGLALVGWLFAVVVTGPHPGALDSALCVWAYLLVQSLYYLVGEQLEGAPSTLDPFERARDRARELMGERHSTHSYSTSQRR